MTVTVTVTVTPGCVGAKDAGQDEAAWGGFRCRCGNFLEIGSGKKRLAAKEEATGDNYEEGYGRSAYLATIRVSSRNSYSTCSQY